MDNKENVEERFPLHCLWFGRGEMANAIWPCINFDSITVKFVIEDNITNGKDENFKGIPVLALEEIDISDVDIILIAARVTEHLVERFIYAGFPRDKIIRLDFEFVCYSIGKENKMPFWFCFAEYIATHPVLRRIINLDRLAKTQWLASVSESSDSAPAKFMPEDMQAEYTCDWRIPVVHHYIDNSQSYQVKNTREVYDRAISRLNKKTFQYYGNEIYSFYDALADYPLSQKRVLIWGLTSCNCDAIALWAGAAHVFVVDYNRPECEHDNVTVITHDELLKVDFKFDVAISYSSFEHDGLGRYGDPLRPAGDLIAMSAARSLLADDGELLLGIPLGRDCLAWNAHRIYGAIRLPMLLDGWVVQDVYSIYGYVDIFNAPLKSLFQSLLVLKKAQENPDRAIRERIEYAKRCLSAAFELPTTKNPFILKQILDFQRKYLRDNSEKAGNAKSGRE